MGPRAPRSTALSPRDEAAIVAFRCATLLALDDLLAALCDAIPRLSRSNLHRCLKRHDVSRLPGGGAATGREMGREMGREAGRVRLDIYAVEIGGEPVAVIVAVEAVSKFLHVAFHPGAARLSGSDVLRALIQAFPCRIRTIEVAAPPIFVPPPFAPPVFAQPPAPARLGTARAFGRLCASYGIALAVGVPARRWGDGPPERIAAMIAGALRATRLAEIEPQVLGAVAAYNTRQRLRVLGARTPHEAAAAI